MKSPKTPRQAAAKPRPAATRQPKIWRLRLYIAGYTPRSLSALSTLRHLCEEHLPNRHEIEVIDLVKNPHLAKADDIVALPTLVRRLPVPVKRLIGDLSNTERVLLGIELSNI